MKVWGSGSQAQINIECKDGMAWIKLALQLGHPAHQHFVPHHGAHHLDPHPRRHKGPARRQKDRERAAAHRQKQIDTAGTDVNTAATAEHEPEPEPSDQLDFPVEEAEAVPASTTSTSCSTSSSSSPSILPSPAEPAGQSPSTASVDPPPLQPPSTVSVDPTPSPQPEIIQVHCIATFENCPDSQISQDYGESLNRFLTSETHLEQNIASARSQHLSSRSLRNNTHVHTVSVVMDVRTSSLWESPANYVRKHLGLSNYWSRGNGTVIKLSRIHQK